VERSAPLWLRQAQPPLVGSVSPPKKTPPEPVEGEVDACNQVVERGVPLWLRQAQPPLVGSGFDKLSHR